MKKIIRLPSLLALDLDTLMRSAVALDQSLRHLLIATSKGSLKAQRVERRRALHRVRKDN
jgi:hypothetical protein